jgi:hypothetical protein
MNAFDEAARQLLQQFVGWGQDHHWLALLAIEGPLILFGGLALSALGRRRNKCLARQSQRERHERF